jgi:hypothetical protein
MCGCDDEAHGAVAAGEYMPNSHSPSSEITSRPGQPGATRVAGAGVRLEVGDASASASTSSSSSIIVRGRPHMALRAAMAACMALCTLHTLCAGAAAICHATFQAFSLHGHTQSL